MKKLFILTQLLRGLRGVMRGRGSRGPNAYHPLQRRERGGLAERLLSRLIRR